REAPPQLGLRTFARGRAPSTRPDPADDGGAGAPPIIDVSPANPNSFESKTTTYERTVNENPGARQASGRLQRQGPRQERPERSRHRQRQDVDEPLRRDRGRGSGPPEGEGRRHRGDRRFLRRQGLPGNPAHRDG